jgi:hypothetical protein
VGEEGGRRGMRSSCTHISNHLSLTHHVSYLKSSDGMLRHLEGAGVEATRSN